MDFVSPLLEWLNANPQWAGFATFLVSAAESIAIVGTVVPGSITMTAIGTLAGAGVIPLWGTIIWAIFGAILGDGISYWLGHYFKDRIRNMWPFRTNPQVLEKGESFVHKYGMMSVFVGRFVGPVRALVPLVAGMLGMRPLFFTLSNVASAIIWAPAYMLPGILLGAFSLELPPDIALHFILVLFLIALFIILCIWITYKLFQLLSYQTEQVLVNLWNKLKRSRFHSATRILKHHDPHQLHGQLTLAFYFFLVSIAFIALVIYVKVVGPQHIVLNDALFHLSRSIRHPTLDNIMLHITLLGQKQIVIPVVIVLFGWLIYKKRPRVAFHALALGLFAGISVLFIKHLVKFTRPWGILYNPETYSMPSGHTTLATTIYLGLAFILANSLPPKRRFFIYFPATLIVFAVGISRIYLGAHWFTDVLGAWLLSAALLMLIILSFHRQFEKPLRLFSTFLVFLLSLIFCYTLFHHFHFNQQKVNYTALPWPTKQVSEAVWWEKDTTMPATRVSLFGFPTQNINIQWVGDLTMISQTLMKEGWTAPPARNWISIIHRIANIQSTEYLPMIPPQYLDKRPILVMARRNGGKKLWVLRLWNSNRIIQETGSPIWVGSVGIIPSAYSWLFRKKHDMAADPLFLFPSKKAAEHWQWRTVMVKVPVNSHKHVDQQILLIKAKTVPAKQ